MKRINGLQVVFDYYDGGMVRILADDSLVHTLANEFKIR